MSHATTINDDRSISQRLTDAPEGRQEGEAEEDGEAKEDHGVEPDPKGVHPCLLLFLLLLFLLPVGVRGLWCVSCVVGLIGAWRHRRPQSDLLMLLLLAMMKGGPQQIDAGTHTVEPRHSHAPDASPSFLLLRAAALPAAAPVGWIWMWMVGTAGDESRVMLG